MSKMTTHISNPATELALHQVDEVGPPLNFKRDKSIEPGRYYRVYVEELENGKSNTINVTVIGQRGFPPIEVRGTHGLRCYARDEETLKVALKIVVAGMDAMNDHLAHSS